MWWRGEGLEVLGNPDLRNRGISFSVVTFFSGETIGFECCSICIVFFALDPVSREEKVENQFFTRL